MAPPGLSKRATRSGHVDRVRGATWMDVIVYDCSGSASFLTHEFIHRMIACSCSIRVPVPRRLLEVERGWIVGIKHAVVEETQRPESLRRRNDNRRDHPILIREIPEDTWPPIRVIDRFLRGVDCDAGQI